MAVAVLNPQPKRDKEERQSSDDPLDKILKAVNIAGTVYNMYDSYSQRAADKLKAQQAEKQKELMGKAELKSKGLTISPEGDNIVDDPTSLAYQEKLSNIKRKSEGDPLARAIQEQTLYEKQLRSKEALDKKAFEKSPEGKIAKLNSSDKQRLDNVSMAMNAIQGMADAMEKGENTFSLVGDNNFTINSQAFEEALGRMQSGGAIGVEEANRFKSMRPKFTDSPEMQQTKLNMLQQEMTKRLITLGVKPEDIGLQVKDISKSVPQKKGMFDLSTPKANANLGKPDFNSMTPEQLKKYLGQ